MTFICRFLLIPFAAGLAWAQEPASEPIRVSSSEVLVDVVVRDAKGRAVRDLQPGEVQVLEDGRPATITSLRLARVGEAPANGASDYLLPCRAAEPHW